MRPLWSFIRTEELVLEPGVGLVFSAEEPSERPKVEQLPVWVIGRVVWVVVVRWMDEI